MDPTSPSSTCEKCDRPIEPHRTYCDCTHFLGFPNRRKAEEQDEVEALHSRYEEAVRKCRKRRVNAHLNTLKRLARNAHPVITMRFEAVCNVLLKGDKYRNRYQRISRGEQEINDVLEHEGRVAVDEKLFPGYYENIVYAALSPDGFGLTTYGDGEVMVQWRGKDQSPGSLEQRAILLERDSMQLYDEHGLMKPETKLPLGYIAVWENREELAVAKLGCHLTVAMDDAEISDLLLHRGTDHQSNEFIEVAIYAEEGLDKRDANQISVKTLKKIIQREEYCDIQSMCKGLGIDFVEV